MERQRIAWRVSADVVVEIAADILPVPDHLCEPIGPGSQGVRGIHTGVLRRRAVVGLIRFGGHLPKGGYDAQQGIKQANKTGAAGVGDASPRGSDEGTDGAHDG